MKHFLLLATVMIALVGCAQGGLLKDANSKYVTSNNGTQIFIVRCQQFVGGGIRYGITVDGWPVANIYPSQYIHVMIPNGLRSIGIEGQSSLTFNFSQGEKYFFKTYMSSTNFGIVIERMNEKDFYEMIAARDTKGETLYEDVSTNIITK